MVELSEKMKRRLEKLSQDFSDHLPDRMEEIRKAAVKIDGVSYDAPEYSEFRNYIHRILGSAATFGFDAISERAEFLEEFLEDVWQKKAPLDKDFLDRVSVYLDDLESSITNRNDRDAHIQIEQKTSESFEGVTSSDRNLIVCIFKEDVVSQKDFQDQLSVYGFETVSIETFAQLKTFLEQGVFVVLHLSTVHLEAEPEMAIQLSQLRNDFEKNFRIIFIAPNDSFDIRLSSVRAGGDAFFTIPVDVTRIIDKIDNMMMTDKKSAYHVLIIDDDLDQISYHALLLQQAGMVTSVCSDPQNLISILIETKPELVLMDMYMSGCNGMELAAIIRQQDAFVGVPIVFLSVEKDREVQLKALRQGGDDFLTKPVDANHLITSVAIRAERTRSLRFFMERDSLTGLLNHTNLKQKLVSETDRTRRIGTELCFAMLDLDHFKLVNDNYGHLAGDMVLKSLSRLLQERLRKTDVIGRYGGEEFGIILFDTSSEHAVRILNEIRVSFSRLKHYAGGKSFSVTLSVGLACFPEFNTPDGVSDAADKALYRSKEEGRNRVTLAHRQL